MNNSRIDSFDEIDFTYEDFTYPLNVECLSRTIKDDFPQLGLPHDDNSLNIVNQVLRTPFFYQLAMDLNENLILSKTITDLIGRISRYCDESYDAIQEEDRKVVKKVNRHLLKKLYPSKVPRSRNSIVPIDAHHNDVFVDNFDDEITCRSNVAEITLIGRAFRVVRIRVRNLSRKTIPLLPEDGLVIDINDDIHTPTFPNRNFDLFKGMVKEIGFVFPTLKNRPIKRFIWRQNFYRRGEWCEVFSIFDFQLKDSH